MIRTRFAPFLVLLSAMLPAVVAGCADPPKGYSENRGHYAAVHTDLSTEESAAKRAHGKDLEDRGMWAEAAEYWRQVAYQHPEDIIAIHARTRRIVCLVKLKEYWLAHQDMVVLVQLYKETLQLTRMQQHWDQLRRIWYEGIGLGLYFKDEAHQQLADDLDPAIKVFQRLLGEEIRGKYAALCLLRIGDCYYQKEEYDNARTTYLRVVQSYADFQDNREHEQAVYKAAGATLATMKGRDYNMARVRSQSSSTSEKGALDLCDDYDKAYADGTWSEQISQLRSRIYDHLAWRDFEAAQVYDRLGQQDAARVQYQLVVKIWGNEQKYPAQQGYVDRARKRISEIDPPSSD